MSALARAGDVKATASTATNYPDDTAPTATGTWAVLGMVNETDVEVASSDGKRLVRSASCQFQFTGTPKSGSGSFTSPPSEVTLKPSSQRLKVVGSDPLVDGDEAKDTYGNKISVSSSATWRTT